MLLKVIGSHVHVKSGSISEMVQGRDVVITDNLLKVIYGP